jgi:signal transduction histidine kinase
MKRHAMVTRPTTSAACATLAEHLRDGPLKTIAELQARAAALAVRIGKNDGDAPDELAELVLLAQTAMAEFRDLTRDLKALVDALAPSAPDRH